MDAVASTIGNMVVSNVLAASIGKTDSTALRTQQAIDAVNGQILPGGIGGVGSGFMPVETPYSSNAALFGVYGGLVDNRPAASSFDATAVSLGLTPDDARRLMAQSAGPSIIDSRSPSGAYTEPVPWPQIAVSPLPESGVKLAQTDGGFLRGLSGDRRSVFEGPAPLSEKIGAGVRAIGDFIADPFIEVGNQYRDVAAAATGATGGWHSTFAQQASNGSYGAAALTEFGAVAGTVPLAGAAFKGAGALAPTADLAFESYAAKTGILSYAADSGFVVGTDGRLTVTLSYTPLAGKEAEFMRQLAGQEAGLNRLTAGEIQSNIDAFNATGRPSSAAQAVAEFRRESPVSGDPFAQAYFSTNTPAPRLAALHEPDMVIGGRASEVTGYGDLAVNSSIGAQNRYLQADVYRAVSQVPPNSYVRFIFGVDK